MRKCRTRLSRGFLDDRIDEALNVLSTNLLGTAQLLWHIGHDMRSRGRGRILITSPIAAHVPGPFAAVYFASKAGLQSLGRSLQIETSGTGLSITLLLPGATDTPFFEREQGLDTRGAHGRWTAPRTSRGADMRR